MDTREKVIAFDCVGSLLAGGSWSVIIGLFDPLTLEQAKRLEQAAATGNKLLAVVDPGENTLLPSDARACLVAALRSVAAITIAEPEQVRLLLSKIPGVFVNDDEIAERKRSIDFVEFIRDRQKLSEVAR
jgi:hypothetical protein